MDLEENSFLKGFTVVGATAALAPTSILFAKRVKSNYSGNHQSIPQQKLTI